MPTQGHARSALERKYYISNLPAHTTFRACAATKIEDLHIDELRREGVSRLFEFDLTPGKVAIISGHKTFSMLTVTPEVGQ